MCPKIADLDETQLRWLTYHIGHSLDIQRELYRIKDLIIELAKVSCVL